VVAINANAQLAALDGNWYSTQWKYGYVLKDGVGVATSTNSPNFQVGQNILQLTATSATTFAGQQVYTDGKFYKVNVKLQADGRLYFEGEKNAKWVMDRIGAPPLASSSAAQTTAPALNQGQTSATASNQSNERTVSRSNQNNSDINTGSTQKNDDARDEAAASLGICAGALLISNSSDPYVQKVSAKIEGEVKRHDALFKSACGQNPQPGPALTACLESLPRETLIYLNARAMAVSEMRSSNPLSFMKNNMQGNNPTVHGIVKMAHCPSTM
jgi:hypothetical protein